MSDISSLIRDVQQLEVSVDWWNSVVVWLTAATAIVAVLYGLSTFVLRSKANELRKKQSELIQEKDRQLSADLRAKDVEIGNAKRAAGEANERAAANDREAAKLQKLAESEKLARIELEASVAWRRLSNEQQTVLANRLRPFAGIHGAMAYAAPDVEAGNFASDIALSLRNAGWRTNEPLGMLSFREGPVPLGTNPPLETGVAVRWSDKESLEAAQALIDALTRLGFDCEKSRYGPLAGKEAAPGKLEIWVDHRPVGPQGEAKLRQQKALANK